MRILADKLRIAAALLAPVCLAPAAAAQESVSLNESLSNVSELPFTRTSSELTAMGMMLQFRHQKMQGDRCFETGCLFIINQTTDYDAIGLYLDVGSPDPDDAPVWGPNLFRQKLRPQLARWTYKLGDASMCTLGTRVVLRHRRTGEQVVSDGTMSLCRSPRFDSSVRINVVQTRVTAEPGSGA